jgi:hypothetical protein
MATGYTAEQLNELWREMEDHIPPIPTRADKREAPTVTTLTAAGTEFGVLFNFGFDSDRSQMMFFNCCAAKELAGALNNAARTYKWDKQKLGPLPSGRLAFPDPDDLGRAIPVTSLSTDSTASGVLVNFYMPDYRGSATTMVARLPPQAAWQVVATVLAAANTAQWWTPDFELIPAHAVN